MSAYGYRKHRGAVETRSCPCGVDYRPREPGQVECRACLVRKEKRGRVVAPKALRVGRGGRRTDSIDSRVAASGSRAVGDEG